MSVVQRPAPKVTVFPAEHADKAIALLRQCTSGAREDWERWLRWQRVAWALQLGIPLLGVALIAALLGLALPAAALRILSSPTAGEAAILLSVTVACTVLGREVMRGATSRLADRVLVEEMLPIRYRRLEEVIRACSALHEYGRGNIDDTVKLELEIVLREAETVWAAIKPAMTPAEKPE
ncbi:MAG: hypothetical protein ACRC33_21090 [Gemmataceae bacterium]